MTDRWLLGIPPRMPVPGLEGWYMRVPPTVQTCVAFVGFSNQAAPSGIDYCGTGFFLFYQGEGYFVTARHVAALIDDGPFVLRVTQHGKAKLIHRDQVK